MGGGGWGCLEHIGPRKGREKRTVCVTGDGVGKEIGYRGMEEDRCGKYRNEGIVGGLRKN